MTIILPIYYTQVLKTKPNRTFLVGLNWERNAHYHIKAKVKRHYHELIKAQLGKSTPIGKFQTETTLYYKSPVCDPRNIISMMDKYLLDGLQEHAILTNDNVKYDMGGIVNPSIQDKINPRVEITIKEALCTTVKNQ